MNQFLENRFLENRLSDPIGNCITTDTSGAILVAGLKEWLSAMQAMDDKDNPSYLRVCDSETKEIYEIRLLTSSPPK